MWCQANFVPVFSGSWGPNSTASRILQSVPPQGPAGEAALTIEAGICQAAFHGGKVAKKGSKTQGAPQAIGELLQKAGASIGQEGRSQLAAMRVIWPALVGRSLARGTEIAKIRGRTLLVRAAHAELARELDFLREHVIRTLGEHVPSARIRDMRIRVEALVGGETTPENARRARMPREVSPARAEEARELVGEIADPELRALLEGWVMQAERWKRVDATGTEGDE